MQRITRLVAVAVLLIVAALGIHRSLQATPMRAGVGGTLVPLGRNQLDRQAAYQSAFRHLAEGGRLWRSAVTTTEALPGDLIVPEGESWHCGRCTSLTSTVGEVPTRAYALYGDGVAVFRSSVRVPYEEGEVVAGWELASIRQLLDGYLGGALPYEVLTETTVVSGLENDALLILPAYRLDAQEEVIARLEEAGGLEALRRFVEEGGTLYVQGTAAGLAERAGLLPEGSVDTTQSILDYLQPEDAFENRGRLRIEQADSPMAYSWVTTTLYVLDDPLFYPDESTEVIATFVNTRDGTALPAIIRQPYGRGEVVAVFGHPTDERHRDEAPIFLDALMMALSSHVDFYGDAVQTFNPVYPSHEFPAYEVVPVSATLHLRNLWDAPLHNAVVTETIAPGYRLLTTTVVPSPTAIFTAPDGSTQLVWVIGTLSAHVGITLDFRAETEPETLASGEAVFAQGVFYREEAGRPVLTRHKPFRLTSRMAARLVGDRDLEPDRHYRIPQEGLYLDLAMPLENKEETAALSPVLTDWVYLIAPIVDYADQHVILSTNDGETIWVRNEPYLWQSGNYPLWDGAVAPTQTITIEDWRALPPDERHWCRFTSTYGIHTELPLRATAPMTDYGSFITIPPTYTDVLTVTDDHMLLLPCWPLVWHLGEMPPYWYDEPLIRYGVHSRELLGREVVFEGTPREGTVVLPNQAGSIYVAAGTEAVPFREYLEAATPYAPAAPSPSRLTYRDVWSRTHTMPLRATFYDVWDWDSCATCSPDFEQHAGVNVTFGIWVDMDGDGFCERRVNDLPTRWPESIIVRYLAKTYSADPNGEGRTIDPDENLLLFPIFRGLGIRLAPWQGSWSRAYSPLTPGYASLVSVTTYPDRDELLFHLRIPLGTSNSFVLTATVENEEDNREGQFKLDDGPRLIYHQVVAGPNRYEIYDGHTHVVEGYRSDGEVEKWGGPTAVSVYSDTLAFIYTMRDPYEPRQWISRYDPFFKAWGYGDLVWSVYVGGHREKQLFHSYLHAGERTLVRLALENNTGITLTGLVPSLQLPRGMTATLLYTDPATAPEPIWAELAFLNRETVPDGWRSLWYFELEVGDDLPSELWNRIIEIPITVAADNLPHGYDVPPLHLAMVGEGDEVPAYLSAPATGLVLTDRLPSNVHLRSAAWITDATLLQALQQAAEVDAAHPDSDTLAALFTTMVPTIPFVEDANGVVTFELPSEARTLAPQQAVAALATISRAHHGPNIVNEGPGIRYTDPFGVQWAASGNEVTVEAHGAAIWVDYFCEGGWGESPQSATADVLAVDGECYIPTYGPSEVLIRVTAYNAGDAIARDVTVTLTLPEGVTATEAIPPWSSLEGRELTWSLGDLAPAAWRQFEIVLYVEPEGAWEEESIPVTEGTRYVGKMTAIENSWGTFFDDFSHAVVSGEAAGPFRLNVRRVVKSLYLPVLTRDFGYMPDLRVRNLVIDADDPQRLSVTVSNDGVATATNFWVDLYLDPSRPPVVNTAWESVSVYGLSWFIPRLDAGEELTLTFGDAYYRADDSRWPEQWQPGSHSVWAFVDSWGAPAPWAAVRESNEDNNAFGPLVFTAGR